jgi:hypothetical protein
MTQIFSLLLFFAAFPFFPQISQIYTDFLTCSVLDGTDFRPVRSWISQIFCIFAFAKKGNNIMNQFTKIIAAQLKLREQAVENTLELLEEGCTIPFISRYRKEKTGNMDEVNIEAIAQANEKLKEMAKRKETILKTIEEQGKLTDALKERIENCWDATSR